MLRNIIAFATIMLVAPPGEAAPSPKARKGVKSKSKSTSKGKALPSKTPKGKRPPRFGHRLRKGHLPGARLKIDHPTVSRPSKKLVGSKRARKPLRLRSLAKPSKVSFAPCAASLPPQAPRVAANAAPKGGKERAVVERSYRWPVGSTLKVGFVDGSREAREAVETIASQWTEHANLHWKFYLGDAPKSVDILIKFDADVCTSNVGTSSRYSAEWGEPSMNLCHMDQWVGTSMFQRIVLHEFGHALALHHEHQSPKMNVEWNKEAVYSYYESTQGWSRDYTDLWVFRRISPSIADSSEYDPDSVMHYSFPAEFTKNGVPFGGKSELSALDKSFIAETYPGKGKASPKRRYERKIAVRNETGKALDIQSIYETKSGSKKKIWAPEEDLGDAPTVRVPAGAERMLDGAGRRLKLVARSTDGRSTWGEWSKTPLRIAPADGYLDNELQVYVVVIDGPPDSPKGQSKAELYKSGSRALSDKAYDDAREIFADFIEKYPSDDLVPWARFNIIIAWHEQRRSEEALGESYDLIIDHPKAEATSYAWFYGGLSALRTGWCDGAKAYFDYAKQERSGLPSDWRDVAVEYLDAIDDDPDRWCW